MSFEELAERWKKAEGSTMKPTTLGHYQNALHAYVLPRFGKRKISTTNREDVQKFLAEMAHNYSESSLRSMRVVLGLARMGSRLRLASEESLRAREAAKANRR